MREKSFAGRSGSLSNSEVGNGLCNSLKLGLMIDSVELDDTFKESRSLILKS